MRKHAGLAALLVIVVAAIAFVRSQATPPALAPPAPTVILVSLDGWRWDYLDKAPTPHLHALAARGIRSEGLIPSFPSMTFPNHYTIVTGLTPDHHGIIANNMVDRRIGPEKFTMASATARDPRWWGGEPVWATAMRQGLTAASMFWPGSEAIHPTYWRPFDGKVANRDRVQQVLDWLALPEAQRPSFVTLYFDEVDHAGHDFGPDSPELLTAASHLDDAIGWLTDGVAALGLESRTTYVIVSDHGMASQDKDHVVFLDDYLSPDETEVVDWSPNVEINPTSTTSADEIYRKLRGKHPALAVYRKSDLPAWLGYGRNPRIPEVVGVAEVGWTITTHKAYAERLASGRPFGGGHGYDTRYRDVHGLFIAAGPTLRAGVTAPEFQNIHIYDFLCRLLRISPAKNDGDPEQTASFFAR